MGLVWTVKCTRRAWYDHAVGPEGYQSRRAQHQTRLASSAVAETEAIQSAVLASQGIIPSSSKTSRGCMGARPLNPTPVHQA